jgi:glycosyltransferase involved in cell wall biosynthesis
VIQSLLFSCIVTCYNRETLIQRALLSILNQTYANFEIVVVDDCSTDKSIEKILALGDNRISIVRHNENKGQNAALNSGLKASRYDYIAFLDSDDEWMPTFLEEMYKAYTADPTISFAYSGCVNGPSAGLEGMNKYGEVLNQGYLSSMITITVKKDAANEIGNFDERYTICQDDDFCFRLSKDFSFKAIEKDLAINHGAANSMTNNLIKVAEGWAFLFRNYRNDIIEYCGNKTLAKHYLDISRLFFRVKQFKKGCHYYFAGLKFFFKSNTANKFNYPLRKLLKETWIILKLNLGHIKRFISNDNDRRSKI